MQKNTRVVLGWLWVIILFILVVGVVVWRNWQMRKIDLRVGVNLVIAGNDGLAILAVRDGGGGFSSWVALPFDLFLDLPEDGGKYRVTSIWKLAEYKKDVNFEKGELLLSALSKSFGAAMSTFIVWEDRGGFGVEDVVDKLLDFDVSTNLTWWDRYSLRVFLASQLKKQKVVLQHLPIGLVLESKTVDGLPILTLFDPVAVDNWSRKEFVVDEILAERLNVSVINNSGKPGKARLVARLLEASGFRVVQIESDNLENSSVCVYKLDDKKFVSGAEMSRTFLETVFGCKNNQNLKIDLNKYRSDIVIVIGNGGLFF